MLIRFNQRLISFPSVALPYTLFFSECSIISVVLPSTEETVTALLLIYGRMVKEKFYICFQNIIQMGRKQLYLLTKQTKALNLLTNTYGSSSQVYPTQTRVVYIPYTINHVHFAETASLLFVPTLLHILATTTLNNRCTCSKWSRHITNTILN